MQSVYAHQRVFKTLDSWEPMDPVDFCLLSSLTLFSRNDKRRHQFHSTVSIDRQQASCMVFQNIAKGASNHPSQSASQSRRRSRRASLPSAIPAEVALFILVSFAHSLSLFSFSSSLSPPSFPASISLPPLVLSPTIPFFPT